MARKSIADRLAQLEAQKKTLQARLIQEERTKETRRKVLLGTLMLEQLRNDNDPRLTGALRNWLQQALPEALARPADQALFAEFIIEDSPESSDASSEAAPVHSDGNGF